MSEQASETVDPDEKRDSVDGAVAPNAEARVHDGNPGFANATIS